MEDIQKNAVLCYIRDNWAYFTTQDLATQVGDEWDSVPYEHNAGEPYAYCDYDYRAGKEPWTITKVAFEGDFVQPSDNHTNSPWSVKMINASACAWLHTPSWKDNIICIQAGVTLEKFCDLIRKGGGKVYVEQRD